MSAGPLNFVMQLVEQQAGQVLQQYQNQLLQLVNKPEVVATLTQLSQLAQGNFVQNVKDVLINLINKVLNNQSPAQAKLEAQQELQAQLQRFSFDLGSIAQSLLNNTQINNALNNLLNQVNIPSNIVDSLLNTVFPLGKRDAADFFLNQLGLGTVWETIKQLGQGFVSQILSIGTQLLFVGSQKWEQAKVIFSQMVQDLTNHVGDASTIVANSIALVNQVLSQTVGRRDLLSVFGLDQVIQTVQALGGSLSTQLTQLAAQVLLAGQEKWNAAKQIFAQLAQDLQSHTFDALPYIQTAVQKLKELLKGQSQKRDLISSALSALGVGDLLQTAQQAGAAAYAQLVATLVGLVGQGKEVLAQAKQVLAQLLEDLKNHTANASTLVQQASSNLAALLAGQGKRDLADFLATLGFNQVVQTAQEAGSAAVAQLTSLAAQALFAGKQKLEQVKQLLAQLVEDLKNHTANATTLVQSAVTQLTQVLQGKPQLKRDLVATALNLFGLDQVVQTIQSVAGDLKNQFLSTITQLLFAGQQAIGQAQGILAQLVQDLKDHAGNAVPLVQQAVAQLSQVVASQAGKRGLNDFVFNALGLNQVVQTLQGLAGDLKNQFMAVATQLLFAGQQAIAQAQGILADLVQNLKDHANNAVPLVQQAVAQLTQVLANSGNF